MYWLELVEENIIYITIGLACMLIILFIINIILISKQRKLTKRYKKFMQGSNGESLEEIIREKFTDIDILKSDSKKLNQEIEKINENLTITFQKIGVVKYDAFKEMGGKLSFVIALLDKNNDGIILNSVHSSREGCYTYLKEIIKGESFLELSKEEKSALNQAINYKTIME
ncbi:MAG: DUF4446 family protein [Bacillota bacterium]|uniref:Putative membrane protein n=1 Tax=Herbinix luporum TaxID=1679721 RepID=A0A0K8J8J5_9FIRM|nr:DUF4446 family protein [Herbinix luporum]MDI9488632.1 DUF4446 family protein [Bacillota bacterium]CUH93925.1 putative membrane protein [Herbinix luporum]